MADTTNNDNNRDGSGANSNNTSGTNSNSNSNSSITGTNTSEKNNVASGGGTNSTSNSKTNSNSSSSTTTSSTNCSSGTISTFGHGRGSGTSSKTSIVEIENKNVSSNNNDNNNSKRAGFTTSASGCGDSDNGMDGCSGSDTNNNGTSGRDLGGTSTSIPKATSLMINSSDDDVIGADTSGSSNTSGTSKNSTSGTQTNTDLDIVTENGDANNSNNNMSPIDQNEDVGDGPGSEETRKRPGSKRLSPPIFAAEEHDERPNKRIKRSQGSDLFAFYTESLGIDGKYRHIQPKFSIGRSPINLPSKKSGRGQRRNVEAIATWQDTVSDTVSSFNPQNKVSWPWKSFVNGFLCKKPPRERVDMSEHFTSDEEYDDWRWKQWWKEGERTELTREEDENFEKDAEAASTRSNLTTAQKKELWDFCYSQTTRENTNMTFEEYQKFQNNKKAALTCSAPTPEEIKYWWDFCYS
mmetsp:Transcript_27384/g.65734  ORF Transcript_27384/g.65734 Transcript_27384/m.65734 type:complete len:466 (-) Transcript_27384:412-1809(-)